MKFINILRIGILLIGSTAASIALSDPVSGAKIEITSLDDDGNFALSSGYDDDGQMTWSESGAWIAELNSINHLGFNDWRLPNVDDRCSAFNCIDSELGQWFYIEFDVSAESSILTSTDPTFDLFSNIQSGRYWSAMEHGTNTSDAWYFDTSDGSQGSTSKNNLGYAWAIRTNNISTVPVPAAAWLFTSGLAIMGIVGRKKSNQQDHSVSL